MRIHLLIAIVFFGITFISCESEKPISMLEKYQRAENFLYQNTDSLVYGKVSNISFDNGTIHYAVSSEKGTEYFTSDISGEKKFVSFNQEELAAALSEYNKKELDPYDLSIRNIRFDNDNSNLFFTYFMTDYSYNTNAKKIEKLGSRSWRESLSPDGLKSAFIRDFNLWIRNTETGEETQLTFDGEEDYGYATNNAGWIKLPGPVLCWSPQSDKIATFRHDGRKVGEMYLWNTQVGHSDLEKWKYPLPGDSAIFMIERLVIHLGAQPKMVKLKMEPDAHRSTTTDHIAEHDGTFIDVAWSEDGNTLSFVSSTRDHKNATLKIADPYTGEVTEALHEHSATYYESGFSTPNWRLLKNTNEFIWFSEKSNWGHLYLYDLETKKLKNAITSGEWSVLEVLHIDQENRVVYFMGSNREEGNPYYHYLYKVNLDGSGLTLLTPETANHSISWNEDFSVFADTYSTENDPGATVVRNSDGKSIIELAKGDISALMASGWVAPELFKVWNRDSTVELWGLMYKPSDFDPSKKYPVLNYLYPGPQTGSVGSRSFRSARSDKQSLAELGFIVVEVDAMGTPGRSKSFHDAYYGNMGDNGLPDQIATIKQLAVENTWMDVNQVGIWGHSGGGYASTRAILEYPDFYKVAVSGAGNHDNRNYEDDWGEKWQGLLVQNNSRTSGNGEQIDLEIQQENTGSNYDNQANQLLAKNLKGKLLIAHGLMDSNVHPSNTLLVVQALIDADKDFDLVIFPNAGHGFGNSRYFLKRRWDYFVRHLQGNEPPAEFIFRKNIR